jgi:hypothetical protein
MKSSMKTILGAAALLLATATTAIADPINGVITFSGNATLNNADITVATGVNAFSGVKVLGATNDFGGLVGSSVNMGADDATVSTDDWMFNSPTGYAGDFWSVGGFVFVLESSAGGYLPFGSGFILASGTGWVYHMTDTTLQQARGTWDFSTQGGDTGGGTFSFSASTSVPDGGTTALLLGLALLGMGVIARRKL